MFRSFLCALGLALLTLLGQGKAVWETRVPHVTDYQIEAIVVALEWTATRSLLCHLLVRWLRLCTKFSGREADEACPTGFLWGCSWTLPEPRFMVSWPYPLTSCMWTCHALYIVQYVNEIHVYTHAYLIQTRLLKYTLSDPVLYPSIFFWFLTVTCQVDPMTSGELSGNFQTSRWRCLKSPWTLQCLNAMHKQ